MFKLVRSIVESFMFAILQTFSRNKMELSGMAKLRQGVLRQENVHPASRIFKYLYETTTILFIIMHAIFYLCSVNMAEARLCGYVIYPSLHAHCWQCVSAGE